MPRKPSTPNLEQMLLFLFNRDTKKSYASRIIFDFVKYAIFWEEHKEEINAQTSAILVTELEKGMPNKDYEKGFRDGLASLPHLWRECSAEKKIMERNSLPNEKG